MHRLPLPALLLALAFLAPRFATADDFPSPGRLDKARYSDKLRIAERQQIDKADAFYRKRDYGAADTQYELFTRRFDKNHDILPYAILMRGCCHLNMRKRTAARRFFSEVIEFYPNSPDAVLALYYQGKAFAEDQMQDEAKEIFDELWANAEFVPPFQLFCTRVWLLKYYRKLKSLDAKYESQYAKLLDEIAKNRKHNWNWRVFDERGDPIYWEAAGYYKRKEDWDGLRKVYSYRYPEEELDELVFKAQMDLVGEKWKEIAVDPAKRKSYLPKVEEMVKSVQARAAAIAAEHPEAASELETRLVWWFARFHTRYDDFHKRATEIMKKYMAAHPEDKKALDRFHHWARDRNNHFDKESFVGVYVAYLNKHPKDGEVRWWVARVLRDRWSDLNKAEEIIKRFGGDHGTLASLYWGRNWSKAAEHYIEHYKTLSDPKALRSTAWAAAESLRHSGDYEKAIKFYKEANRGMDSTYHVAVCLQAMGRLDQAVAQLREIRSFTDDKQWRGKAGYREGTILWEKGDRAPAIKVLRWVIRNGQGDYVGHAHQFLEKQGIDPKGGATE